jgi:SAM-dependent methyltransferase
MDDGAALQAYYARDEERDRLAVGVGRVEFARTIEVVRRTLPEPPAVVADIGGGPGRYTDWLVEVGYTVIHRDVIEHHVDQVRQRHGASVDAAVGDARDIDLADGSVDAVLCLGPLYHLPEADDRATALAEAHRVARPRGHVYAATITRWAPRLHGMLVQRTHERFPVILDEIDEMERTGWMRPIIAGGFTGYAHTPDQLRDEIAAAGLELRSLVNLEGMSAALADVDERMDDPDQRAFLLETLRVVESEPDLLGTGPHLLATAQRAP